MEAFAAGDGLLMPIIHSLPDDAEKPVVSKLLIRSRVIQVAISGPIPERDLKILGQRARDEPQVRADALVGDRHDARDFVRESRVSVAARADGSVENFNRRRQTEIKHGRISMLATMGYITPLLRLPSGPLRYSLRVLTK